MGTRMVSGQSGHDFCMLLKVNFLLIPNGRTFLLVWYRNTSVKGSIMEGINGFCRFIYGRGHHFLAKKNGRI